MADDKTAIWVSRKTRDVLDKMKPYPSTTFDEVLQDLLKKGAAK